MREGKRRAIVAVSPAGHPGLPQRGLLGGGGEVQPGSSSSCLFEMDVFDKEASAIESLTSGTYITVKKELIVRHLHYNIIIIFHMRTLRFR